ncbi:MAG: hypothetical protein LBE04_03965 [Prevotellaceae bacterium]|jgi:hypothetical protein|nr:hypothetical protein [Prevotellaceae bacterium]
MANNDFSKTTEQRKENLRKILTPIIATVVTMIGCAIIVGTLIIIVSDYYDRQKGLFYFLLVCSAVVFSIIFLLISAILLIRKIDLDNTGKYRTVVHYLYIAIFILCIIGLFAVILSSIN